MKPYLVLAAFLLSMPADAETPERRFGIGFGYGAARLTKLADYEPSYFSRLFIDYRYSARLSLNLSAQYYSPFSANNGDKFELDARSIALGASYRFPLSPRIQPFLGVDINWWDLKESGISPRLIEDIGTGFKAGLFTEVNQRMTIRFEAARHLGIDDAEIDQINFGVIRYY